MIELSSSQMTYLKALGRKDISRFRDFQEKTLLTDYEKSRVRGIGGKL